MSKYANLWLALSSQALTEFRNRRTQGDSYTGPMDDETYRILDKMSDQEVVKGMFKSPTIGGKTYNLFSVYLEGTAKAARAIEKLTTDWPTHFFVIGAWWMDGRQIGTEWEIDEDELSETYGQRTGNVTGTPVYPIPAAAWRIMPDVVTYDSEGNEASRIPATSNADLRDINVLQGQQPRRFT